MQDTVFLRIDNFDNYDYFKTTPFEIEYAYKHSAPYFYDGQRWTEFNFNGIKTPFKTDAWDDLMTFWKEEYYNESLERITYENINPYFEAYHKGFMKAYSEHESKIKESTSIFGNNQTFSNCVFDGAMKMVHGVGYRGSFIDKKRVKVIQIKNWYECGLLAGENYKAWYLIVNNHREFISLFRTSEIMINFYKAALFHTEDISFTAGTRERLTSLLNELSTPAPKEIEQGKVTERKPYKSEDKIHKELIKFKEAVTDICVDIKGLSNDKFPTIAKIKTDALSNCGLSERVINLNIKKSTTLTKTGFKAETATGHIYQIVGQFFRDNKLILKKLKLTP